MAWTTPITAVANATFTAAQFNASVRDNLLQTAPALATAAGRFMATTGTNSIAERIPSVANVATTESTGATSYSALTTAGPAVTVTTGPIALVTIGANMSGDTVGANVIMSYAVSSATTVAASDTQGCGFGESAASRSFIASRVTVQALTAGSNIFTAQYRVSGGNGSWGARHIGVIPF